MKRIITTSLIAPLILPIGASAEQSCLDWSLKLKGDGEILFAKQDAAASYATKLMQKHSLPYEDKNLSLLDFASHPLLLDTLYRRPGRLLSDFDEQTGAVSRNKDFEAGRSQTFFIELQRFGADLIQAGIATNNSDLISQGVLVIDHGFTQWNADGSFNSQDTLHSTSLFVEAAARALLLLSQGEVYAHDAVTDHWREKLKKSAQWMAENREKGIENNLKPFTHRYFLRASGLSLVAKVLQTSEFDSEIEYYTSEGLLQMTEDGVNPERDGFDVSYQMVGVNYMLQLLENLERTNTVYEDPLAYNIFKNIKKFNKYLRKDGSVSTIGSTRVGQEEGRDGKVKDVDAKTVLFALTKAHLVFGDDAYLERAERIAMNRKWISDGYVEENNLSREAIVRSSQGWNPSKAKLWNERSDERDIPNDLLKVFGPYASKGLSYAQFGVDVDGNLYSLKRDINFCSNRGLILTKDVVLNGNGFSIIGDKTGKGIVISGDKNDNTMVNNLVIDSFKTGYLIREADGNILRDVEIINTKRPTKIKGDAIGNQVL